MAKSRRKHPGFTSMEETPQGRWFLEHVWNMVGGQMRYVPLERLADNTHVWRIDGDRAWGLLVERPVEQDGDSWVQQWGFRLVEPVDPSVVVQATMAAKRWDPWLAFGHGDDSPVRTATRRQRREWDARRAASGTQRDRVQLTVRPRGRRPADLVDVDDTTLRALAERHRPDPPPHLAAVVEASLHDRVRDVLLRMADRVEVDRDGDFSLPFGSARVFVRVIEMDPAPVVSVWAVTNVDVPASPQLLEYVATHADRWLFGHLGARVADDGTAYVVFSHRLFGEFLDDDELAATVSVVGSTADRIDDDIQRRFGGATFAAAGDTDQDADDAADLPTGMYL